LYRGYGRLAGSKGCVLGRSRLRSSLYGMPDAFVPTYPMSIAMPHNWRPIEKFHCWVRSLGKWLLTPLMLWIPENSEVVRNGFGNRMEGTFAFSRMKDSVDCQGPPVAFSASRPGQI